MSQTFRMLEDELWSLGTHDHKVVQVHKKVKEVYNQILDGCEGHFKTLVSRAYVAGGCFKSLYLDETVNDYDIYFRDEADAIQAWMIVYSAIHLGGNNVFSNRDKLCVKDITRHAMNFWLNEPGKHINQGIRIQFIFSFNGEPQKVIQQFDFQHCMSYYDPSTQTIKIPTYDISSKVLKYNTSNNSYPLHTLQRAFKFAQQGWLLPAEQMLLILKETQKIDLSDSKKIEDAISEIYRIHMR